MKKDTSLRSKTILALLALLFIAAGVWALVSPDDGSRGPRLPLTSTEAGIVCLVVGVVAAVAAIRTRSRR